MKISHYFNIKANFRYMNIAYYIFIGIIYAGMILLANIVRADDNSEELKYLQQVIEKQEKNLQKQKQQHINLFYEIKKQKKFFSDCIYLIHSQNKLLNELYSNKKQIDYSSSIIPENEKIKKKIRSSILNNFCYHNETFNVLPDINIIESKYIKNKFSEFIYSKQKYKIKTNNLHTANINISKVYNNKKIKNTQKYKFLEQKRNKKFFIKQTNTISQKTINIILNNKKNFLHPVSLEKKLLISCKKHVKYIDKKSKQYKKEKIIEKTYENKKNNIMHVICNKSIHDQDRQVLWPVYGRTLHHFGEPQNGDLCWKGLVIAAHKGSKVKAVAPGRVLVVNWLQGYSLIIVIEHGKGNMSLYGYNQSALVHVGDQVKAGQPIALVGDRGDSGTASLYFEIRRQGEAVNPISCLFR